MQSRREKILDMFRTMSPDELTAAVVMTASARSPNDVTGSLISLVGLMSVLSKALPERELPNCVLAMRELSDDIEARYINKKALTLN